MAEKITQEQKKEMLEEAVTYKSAAEAGETCKSLGKILFSSRALGIACRFKGIDYVKALVENGATFVCDYTKVLSIIYYWRTDFSLTLLDINEAHKRSVSFHEADQCFTNTFSPNSERKELKILPREERLKSAEYLLDNIEKCELNTNNFFMLCIISGDEDFINLCRKKGVKFSDEYVEMLTQSSRKLPNEWSDFCEMVCELDFDDFRAAIENIRRECGGAEINFTDIMRAFLKPCLGNVDFFKFVLDNFNQAKMNQKSILHDIINENAIPCLPVVEKLGWLKMPRKRDEYIQYASENGKTEVTAWLMDFKNRTADFAAERDKAEKKIQRELNAAPDSLSVIKQTWGFTKRKDGTLCITNYKGGGTVVEVPEKLGKNTVTAIGRGAFSPYGPRKTDEIKANMKNLTKVILPKTVNTIEENAFSSCRELLEVNIPDGVEKIEDDTFNFCKKLKSIQIPNSVKTIGQRAFNGCSAIKELVIPNGVVEIGEQAFSQCAGIKSVSLPESLEKIGAYAFDRCENLERINIPDKINEIEKLTFMSCKKLKAIEIPETVKNIGEFALVNCESLEHIKIPNGISLIEQYTFAACTNLKSIELPDTLEKIRKNAFDRCSSLKHIELPNSVVQIDMCAFKQCPELETVVIPPSVKKIEYIDTVFEDSPKVTVIVEPKSYAERCCKQNKIPYKYKGEE